MLDYFKSRLLTEIKALKENITIPRFFVCDIYGRLNIWDERTDCGELDECEEDMLVPWDNCDDEITTILED